ncbi:cell division protein FtsL [Listeria aquatica]|uniref:Cell division protein FtsL n=2 Tax=Listeria aquatica TaxID=1494960 RepID=W7B2R1_9LIST|nr:cell division protein FtsL [Listeria aquatica]EUJ19705.1 cell division protein FtsL [Listeria aquatica FSL S10-1188]MBC1520449.1 cell division protein FtsL [Listeria aquatica]
MSNVAYKSNLEPKRIHTEHTEEQKQILVKRKRVTTGEKIIVAIAIVVVAVIAFQIIRVQASIYDVNQSVETTESKLSDQEKNNADLKVQVNDLGRYERILQKAKEKGLKLDGDNVKVVDGK